MTTAAGVPLTFIRVQQTFVAVILPRVEQHARVHFRHVPSAEQKEEWTAEAVALAWHWHVRLTQQGRDTTCLPSALATFAARAVKCGRRLCGQERAKDVLSSRAQKRRDFTVQLLPQGSSLFGNVFDEALHDNTRSPVPDQVAFRLDFPAWQATQTERDRRLIEELIVGERTLDIADRFGLSPARISQKRRDFHDDWLRFCDLPSATEA